MPNYKIGIDLDADDNASGSIKKVTGAADSLDKAFAGANSGAGGLGASLGGLVSPAGLALGAVTAVGGAMVATGAYAMDLASQVDESSALMMTQLGLTTEEAAGFQGIMRDIYAANYGESFEDVAASMVAVEQGFARIGGVGDEEMQEVTQTALMMRDAFGTDVSESVGAAATLMENFGLTSAEAMDFLVAAQQRGLNSSGDLLDSIGEYTVQYAGAGGSASGFFSLLEQGNMGGVLGTDKLLDAQKEFSIRFMDDSKQTRTALGDIGLDYDKLKQGITDNSITQVDAMHQVIEKLNQIEDPIARNVAGAALFGTQWEDATEKGSLGLEDTEDALGNTEGAAESLAAQYNTTSDELQAATRIWDDALVDVGDELNDLAAEALPYLAKAMTDFVVPAIDNLATFLVLLSQGKGISWDWGQGPGTINVPGFKPLEPDLPVAAPNAQGSSFGGSETHVNVYVERGDPDTVMQATQLGVSQAQRMRGE